MLAKPRTAEPADVVSPVCVRGERRARTAVHRHAFDWSVKVGMAILMES